MSTATTIDLIGAKREIERLTAALAAKSEEAFEVLNAVERIAFGWRAPNEYTPQIIQFVVTARAELHRRRASASTDSSDERRSPMIESRWELLDGTVIITQYHSHERASALVQSPNGWATSAQADYSGQFTTAARLGYGNDVGQMTVDHDPLHAVLAYTMGQESFSLRWAAGHHRNGALLAQGLIEETAVMELQKLLRMNQMSTLAWAKRIGAAK